MESNIAGSGSWNRPRKDSFSLSSFRQSEAEQLASDADPWGWVDQEYDEVRQDVSTLKVTAVLVAFDAARWLPDTLAGAGSAAAPAEPADRHRQRQHRCHPHAARPGRRPRDLGCGLLGQTQLRFRHRGQSALRQDRARRAGDTATTQIRPTANDDSHWLWLLHDDASPAPDALYRLLAHVAADHTIDITGPKLLLPRRRQAGQQISEVGVSISGSGRRDLALDPGELDQGQRDQPQARLGVSTCGMLVRMAVWNDLDGLDPAIPVFRDGVEFGWRAHLNGYRVVTTPSAMLTHRQVGRAGLRPRGLTGRRPGQVDRQLGMIVVAGHAPGKMLPLVWLRLFASCLALAVGYLIGKVPGRALDEILALGWFCSHPGQVRDLRTRTASIDPAPGTGEVVQALRPPWWSSLRVGAEVLSGAASDRYRSVAGDAEAASLDELTGDDFSSLAEERQKSLLLSPIVLTTVVAVVASVIAARSLIGLGALAGPALLPAPDRLGELWDAAIHPIVGAPSQISPPWLALAALGATCWPVSRNGSPRC